MVGRSRKDSHPKSLTFTLTRCMNLPYDMARSGAKSLVQAEEGFFFYIARRIIIKMCVTPLWGWARVRWGLNSISRVRRLLQTIHLSTEIRTAEFAGHLLLLRPKVGAKRTHRH